MSLVRQDLAVGKAHAPAPPSATQHRGQLFPKSDVTR